MIAQLKKKKAGFFKVPPEIGKKHVSVKGTKKVVLHMEGAPRRMNRCILEALKRSFTVATFLIHGLLCLQISIPVSLGFR